MFVAPEARGTGTGAALLRGWKQRRAPTACRSCGSKPATACTPRTACTQRHGFTLRGPFGDYRDDPQQPVHGKTAGMSACPLLLLGRKYSGGSGGHRPHGRSTRASTAKHLMHLLAATPGAIDDGTEPVDLGQTPADVVFLSAADTELAALSEARAEMTDPPTLRLASLNHLRHPMSVDLHIDELRRQIETRHRPHPRRRRLLALRRGTIRRPPACRRRRRSPPCPATTNKTPTCAACPPYPTNDYDALWSYLVEGGPENSTNFLAYARWMLARQKADTRPTLCRPLLRAGVYWPGAGTADLEIVRKSWTDGAPIVPLIFYRALVQGAGLHPINRLTRALLRQGQNPLPVFVASLKDPVSAATLDTAVPRRPARRDPELHRLRRRLAARRTNSGKPTKFRSFQQRAGVPGRPRLVLGTSLGRRPHRPFRPRHRDERGPARGRRPHPVPRHQLQGRGVLRRRHPMPHRHLPRAGRPDRFRRAPRRELDPPAPHPRRRQKRRPDPRQLPQQGRPPRQRRRPRHPRRHCQLSEFAAKLWATISQMLPQTAPP